MQELIQATQPVFPFSDLKLELLHQEFLPPHIREVVSICNHLRVQPQSHEAWNQQIKKQKISSVPMNELTFVPNLKYVKGAREILRAKQTGGSLKTSSLQLQRHKNTAAAGNSHLLLCFEHQGFGKENNP